MKMPDKIKLTKPTLILGCGISSSGKTTVLKELTKWIDNSFLIDKDILNQAFLLTHAEFENGILAYKLSGLKIPREDGHYSKHVRLQSYHCMLELAKHNIESGKHPILDGNFTKEIIQGYLDKILIPFFKEIDCRIKIIFCYADEEVIKKRLSERNLSRDREKIKSEENWKNFLEKEPILPKELEKYDNIKVDTTKPLEENTQKIIEYLRT